MTEREFEGVILRTFASSDYDLILRVATPQYGKLSLFAKNARGSGKRYRTRFDILDMGTFSTRDGSNGIIFLERFSGRESFSRLRGDLDKVALASLLCECADRLIPEEDAEAGRLATTLIVGLRAVDDAPELLTSLRQSFLTIVSLLRGAGFFDTATAVTPSAANLLKLLSHVESVTERELATRGAVQGVLNSLRSSKPSREDTDATETPR